MLHSSASLPGTPGALATQKGETSSRKNVPKKARPLLDRLQSLNALRSTYAQSSQWAMELIEMTGTDMEKNESDELGNGDQSDIATKGKRQIMRELWAFGGNINSWVLRRIVDEPDQIRKFPKLCINGRVTELEHLLSSAKACSPGRQLLLETRHSSMRLSSIMMTVALVDMLQPGKVDCVGVVALLLKYGANPTAQDVAGRTVVHYGAGMMATEQSLKMVELCIEAAKSHHMYGKQVELCGLSTASMNGKRGVCAGYVYQNNASRRSVVLGTRQVAIKIENLKLVNESDKGYKPKLLADVQDRMGCVALHEVMMTERKDSAEFLLQKGASLDIKELDQNTTPREMCMRSGYLKPGTKKVVNKYIVSNEKQKRKDERFCEYCHKRPDTKLLICSGCHMSAYCNAQCQHAHWKAHKVICKASKQKDIKLEAPGSLFQGYLMPVIKDFRAKAGGYRKPLGVSVDEKFWVRVIAQCDKDSMIISDESMSCGFDVSPGNRGYDEIMAKVREEKAFHGLKSYFRASFDKNGDCTMFLESSSVKSW